VAALIAPNIIAQASMPTIELRIASIVIANPPGSLWMPPRCEL
jgi:hypothetical protein